MYIYKVYAPVYIYKEKKNICLNGIYIYVKANTEREFEVFRDYVNMGVISGKLELYLNDKVKKYELRAQEIFGENFKDILEWYLPLEPWGRVDNIVNVDIYEIDDFYIKKCKE